MKKITLISFLMFFSMLVTAQNDSRQIPQLQPNQNKAVLKKAVQGKERQQKTNLKKNARKAGNNELVTPPDGTSPDLWEYQAGTFSLMTGSGWQDYTSDATKEFKVVIDGQDVYISGLSYYFKDSWIKGNIENGKVIIPKGQIAGKDDFGAVYINGQDFDDESSDAAPIDIVFIYDENKKQLTLNSNIGIIECESPEELECFCFWEDLIIKKPTPEDFVPISPPEGIDIADMPLTGKAILHPADISTTVKVGVDGNDIYIQGLVIDFPNSWVKGNLENGVVTFPIRFIGNVDGKNYFITSSDSQALTPFTMYYDSERNTYEANTQLLLNTSKTSLKGDELLNYYSGLYIGPRPERVTPPNGLATKPMPYKGKNAQGVRIKGNVNVAFDGNDVWFKGLDHAVPDGWFKGVFNEDRNVVTVAYGQYMGEDIENGYGVYIAGDIEKEEDKWDIGDVIFKFDNNNKIFELQNNLFFNGKKDAIYYIDVIRAGLKIGEKYDITWIAKDQDYNDGQDIETISLAEGVTATLSKNGVKDGPKYYVIGEAVRMYAQNTIKISSDKKISKVIFTMTGSETQMHLESDKPSYTLNGNTGIWTGEAKEVTFTVPNVSSNQARIQRIDIIYFNYAEEIVSIPSDLVTEEYHFKATNTYSNTIKRKKVKVGFYGDDEVYIQGLSEYSEKAWVKGNLTDGVLNIPNWDMGQSFIFGVFDIAFSGASFDYNADEGKFYSVNGYNTVDTNTNLLMDEFLDITIAKIIEIATKPMRPEIKNYIQTDDGYDIISAEIPLEDTNERPIVADKLTYSIYTDINGEISLFEFKTDEYSKLEENMTEIPYNFTDSYDFRPAGQIISFYDANRSKWDQIGIKSIYRGGGETNESEISWFNIKEYLNIEKAEIAEGQTSTPIYNMQGIKVEKPLRKGIYISNGKKFVVK